MGPMKGSSTCLAKIFKSQLDHFEDEKKSQLRKAMQKFVVLVSYTVNSPRNWLQEIMVEEGIYSKGKERRREIHLKGKKLNEVDNTGTTHYSTHTQMQTQRYSDPQL